MEDGIKKTALAREIFGRGGAELIPLLNNYKDMLGEYTEVINAFSMSGDRLKKFADDSDDIGDRFQIIGIVIKKLKLEFSAGLYPAIKQTQEQFLKFVLQNKKQIFVGIAKSVMLISKGFEFALKGIKLFGEASARLTGDMKWITDNKNKNNATKLLNALKEFATVLPVLVLLAKAIKLVTSALGPWGIAFLIIIAAIDDLIAYMNGEGSVIGVVAKWLKDPTFNNLPKEFQTMFGKIKKEAQTFDEWIKSRDWVKKVSDWIYENSPEGLTNNLKFAAEKARLDDLINFKENTIGIGTNFDILGEGNLADLVNMQFAADSFLSEPPPPMASQGMTTTEVKNEYKIDQTFEVNVKTDADPAKISEEVGKTMKSEMDRTLRQAQQAIESGET